MDLLKSDFAQCQAVLKSGSKTFYFASKALPHDKSDAFAAIYAYCKSTDDIADEGNAAPENRLNQLASWKKQTLLSLKSGKSDNAVLRAFSHTARHHRIPASLPLELISAVSTDANRTPFRTFRQLRRYCYGVASVVGLMLLHVMGVNSKRAQKYAVSLGIAMQLTNILRDVEEDLGMGRLYLPEQELTAYGLVPEDIKPTISGEKAAALRQLIEFQCCRARQYYSLAMKGIPHLPKTLQLAIFTVAILYSRILDGIESRNYQVFNAPKRTQHKSALFSLSERIT